MLVVESDAYFWRISVNSSQLNSTATPIRLNNTANTTVSGVTPNNLSRTVSGATPNTLNRSNKSAANTTRGVTPNNLNRSNKEDDGVDTDVTVDVTSNNANVKTNNVNVSEERNSRVASTSVSSDTTASMAADENTPRATNPRIKVPNYTRSRLFGYNQKFSLHQKH